MARIDYGMARETINQRAKSSYLNDGCEETTAFPPPGLAAQRTRQTISEQLAELGKTLIDIRAYIDDALEPKLNPIMTPQELKDMGVPTNSPNPDSEIYTAIKEIRTTASQIRSKLSEINGRVQL